MPKNQIKNMFDSISPHYDTFNRISSFGIEHIWRNKLKKIITKNGRILDLGTGTGKFLDSIKRKKMNFVGIDFSFKMMKKGQKKRSYINFLQSEAERLPFKNNSFDYIISAFVFRNLENMKKTVSEAKRVMKEKGKLIILEFYPPDNILYNKFFKFYLSKVIPIVYKLFGTDPHSIEYFHDSIYNFYNKNDFKLLLRGFGFDKIESIYLPFEIAHYFILENNEKN